MRVSEVMTEDPVWVDASATVGEAARKLAESSVRHVPVLRGGVVVGILSDRDLRSVLPSLDALLDDPSRLGDRLDDSVPDVMTATVVRVEPDRDLKDAVDLMIDHGVGAVPVVDPGSTKLVGIVSYVDVLRAVRDGVWG